MTEMATSSDQQAIQTDLVASWLAEFAQALAQGSRSGLEALLAEEVTWRDFMAFDWNFSNAIDRDAVVSSLLERATASDTRGFTPHGRQAPVIIDGDIYAFFDFTTGDRLNRGYVRLVPDGVRARALTLQTQVEELADHPWQTGHNRSEGKVYDVVMDRTRWADDRNEERTFADSDPAVLVLGAGHNGLSLAARLGALDVPTLVIDREARVGDQWRKRYAALALHSSVYGDHLPYMDLPPTWPAHVPKDKFADWLESYVTLMDLNVWTSTTFINAHYHDDTQCWTVRVRLGDGTTKELHPRHFIVAAGLFGGLKTPDVDGIDSFTGLAVHSDHFQDAASYSGKRALVIGSGVSGHELSHDLHEHGAEVTMVQRSSTYVITYGTYHKYFAGLFTEDPVMTPDYADQIAYAVPNERSDDNMRRIVKMAAEDDRELLDALQERGFKLNWGPEGTGIIGAHMSGKDSYQIDIGASQLIADGRVALKNGVVLDAIKDGNTAVFSDGSVLADVDLIVFATGYHQLWGHIGPTLGNAAAKIDKAYGRAADGEYANTWRRSAQPGLWFATGFIRMARFYTKFTSLLIKAIEEGIEPIDPDRPPA